MSASSSSEDVATAGAGLGRTPLAGDARQGAAHRRWLNAARAGVVVIIILSLVILLTGIPFALAREQTSADVAVLRGVGLSPRFWAVYHVTHDTLLALGSLALAGVLIWRRPRDWMAVYVALLFALPGIASHVETRHLLLNAPLTHLPRWLNTFVAPALTFLFFYLFPDGRFVPRWWSTPFIVITAINAVAAFAPDSPIGHTHWPAWLHKVNWMGSWAAGLSAQIYRYHRVSTPLQRQQTKWVVYGLAVAILGSLLLVAPVLAFPALNQPGPVGVLALLVARPIMLALQLVVPMSIGLAVLRYRLWDVDILINRTLVYAGLTASIAGVYVLVVGGVGFLLQARGNLAISVLATALVAVLVQPLRAWLHRAVNRLMYGERDEPYAVIARLSRRLGGTLAPEAVLPTIVQTVREALKLPYVALVAHQDGAFTIMAAAGEPPASAEDTDVARGAAGKGDGLFTLPLTYQNATLGQLLLAPRSPGEHFSPADRRLLDDLARQAGVAVHAARLTTDLQLSRERLVMAREEERRRLRRDLHDGLGPALAAQTLKVGSARYLLDDNPAAADRLLAELENDIDTAMENVRHLVYNLRPPALDELGLVAAIRSSAARYAREGDGSSHHGTVYVSVEAPEWLPALPAAIEVAAYRIVQEALTNIVRHAHAQSCCILLAIDGTALRIEIRDDGAGLPAERHMGVGLQSMRERAEELGGMCRIEADPAGGTRVLASLPLPHDATAAQQP